jgi:hypothetical protein
MHFSSITTSETTFISGFFFVEAFAAAFDGLAGLLRVRIGREATAAAFARAGFVAFAFLTGRLADFLL